jgi:porphobilinogen deaminase
MLEAVTPADLKAIIKAQVAKARKGDANAARLILSYTAGAPMTAALAVSIEPASEDQRISIVRRIIIHEDIEAPSPNGTDR